jgi:RNA polymerase sigma-70 factor (ECF subfamily)
VRFVVSNMNAPCDAIAEMEVGPASVDLESIFRTQYPRIARVIARIIGDPARAEELAVEAFLKLWRNCGLENHNPEAWLYRVAVRSGIDELRQRTRRARYESILNLIRTGPTPEEIYSTNEDKQRVRIVLASIDVRQAELLMLRSYGLSYDELAVALDIKATSVGTLLGRAQQAFRKNFVSRFGDEHGKY